MDFIEDKLQNFKVAKYRFIFQPLEELKLEKFAGASLRRDFIPIFKQITCLCESGFCDTCKHGEECPFHLVMQSGGESDDPDSKRFQTPPKPFIFEPPLDRKSFYRVNDEFALDLVLIGNALQHLPKFAASLRRLAEIGIGKNRAKLALKNIIPFDLHNNSVSGNYKWNEESSWSGDDVAVSLSSLYAKYEKEYNKISELSVSFITPVRMKRLGSENWHLHFRGLMRNVLTRISNLAHRYCEYPALLDFPETVQRSGLIRTEKEKFFVEDSRAPGIKRNHDSRRDGSLGNIIYKGNLTDFWGILRLAELIHLGKNTSFGFGRILVEPHELTSVPAEEVY